MDAFAGCIAACPNSFLVITWLRLRLLELPFAMIGLIWKSIMSWAGGWFFLMAVEIFTVGPHDFRLPGLGAYLQAAASQGDFRSAAFGLAALILTIVALDQFIWRSRLAWADRFKVQIVEYGQSYCDYGQGSRPPNC